MTTDRGLQIVTGKSCLDLNIRTDNGQMFPNFIDKSCFDLNICTDN